MDQNINIAQKQKGAWRKNFFFKQRSKTVDLFFGLFFHFFAHLILVCLFIGLFFGWMAISLNNMGSGGAEGGWIMIFGIPIIIELSIFFSVIIDLIFAFLKKSMMFFAGALLALLIPFLLNFIFSGPFWGPFNWIFMIIDKVLQF